VIAAADEKCCGPQALGGPTKSGAGSRSPSHFFRFSPNETTAPSRMCRRG